MTVTHENKTFHIGDVLSITTGKLVSPRHMDGIYDILNFMLGANLFTHQLGYASEECRPVLLKQFPQLAEVDASGVNENNLASWLVEQSTKYGEYLEVESVGRVHDQ